MNASTINIADLLQSLDQSTLDALSARLHEVANNTHTGSPIDPAQLLFSFIDDGLEAHEEFDPTVVVMLHPGIERNQVAA
jgi:hypothetical protein